MFSRNAIRLFACAVLFGSAGSLDTAHAQGVPFTIRRPPDGSTVREKVNVEIPRSSIGPGAFVAIYLDDKFAVAVPPEPIPEKGAAKPFTFVWDTKGTGVSDGPHNIKAVLYVPASDNNTAVSEKSSTSVRLEVANKIHNGPSVLRLRYKLPTGEDLQYSRNSTAKVTNSGIMIGDTNDTVLAETSSKLVLDIISPTPVALVRNKLTELSILQQGQETSLDKSQLSGSMYQEINSLGAVQYETGNGSGLEEFSALGLPVNNTLELPLLPEISVAVGQSWPTYQQRLDIPGVATDQQPRVTLQNTLTNLEWEGGRPTAKIHQTYDGEGAALPQEIDFGSIPVTAPQVKFERDIYFAYNAGVLVKTVRTVTVTGRTTVQTDPSQPTMGVGSMGMGRTAGFPGGGSSPGGAMSGSMMGAMMGGGKGRGMMGSGFPGGGSSPGSMMGGQRGMMGSGFPGGGSSPGGMMGGQRGMMGGGFPGGGSSPGGMMGGQRGMMGGQRGMIGRGSPVGGVGAAQEQDHPVVLKAVTETELIKITNP